MAKTRFKATAYFQNLVASNLRCSTAMSVVTGSFASLAISTTFDPPAKGITLGNATHSDATSKLNGVYLYYSI